MSVVNTILNANQIVPTLTSIDAKVSTATKQDIAAGILTSIETRVYDVLNVQGNNFDIRDLNRNQDSVDVTGSQVSVTKDLIHNYYNEVLSVASGAETTIISKVILVLSRLKLITVSGTNIAEYKVILNGVVIDKLRTQFGSALNAELKFDGISLSPTDVLEVKVLHLRPSMGNFNTKLIIEG